MNKEEETFEYPKWWECQWRREPCNKADCPLCHSLMKRELKHSLDGKDPNDMETVADDAADSLGEAMIMLDQIAKQEGIDLDSMPEPEMPDDEETRNTPIYKSIHSWTINVHKFLRESAPGGAPWLETEAGKDIVWYHTMIPAKVFRQLNNCWRIKHDITDTFDYDYTKGVIEEIVKILKNAFQNVLSTDLPYFEKIGLRKLYDEFLNIERDLLSI